MARLSRRWARGAAGPRRRSRAAHVDRGGRGAGRHRRPGERSAEGCWGAGTAVAESAIGAGSPAPGSAAGSPRSPTPCAAATPTPRSRPCGPRATTSPGHPRQETLDAVRADAALAPVRDAATVVGRAVIAAGRAGATRPPRSRRSARSGMLRADRRGPYGVSTWMLAVERWAWLPRSSGLRACVWTTWWRRLWITANDYDSTRPTATPASSSRRGRVSPVLAAFEQRGDVTTVAPQPALARLRRCTRRPSTRARARSSRFWSSSAAVSVVADSLPASRLVHRRHPRPSTTSSWWAPRRRCARRLSSACRACVRALASGWAA